MITGKTIKMAKVVLPELPPHGKRMQFMYNLKRPGAKVGKRQYIQRAVWFEIRHTEAGVYAMCIDTRAKHQPIEIVVKEPQEESTE